MHPVTLLPGGERFEAGAGETVLAAALRAGHLLPYSCRNGQCGSCRGFINGPWRYADGSVPVGLTADERAQGMVLLCRAVPEGAVTVTAKPVARVDEVVVRTLPCRIARIERFTDDVAALWLRLPSFETFHYRAGQFVDVLLPHGKRRSYSIANAPRDREPLEIHVRHHPGGVFSGTVFAGLPVGTLLRIEGPLGTFFIRDGTRPAFMLAGSTGFAPLKAMLEHMIDTGRSAPVDLWWGARDEAGLYHRALLDRWQHEHAWFRWHGVAGGFVHERAVASVADQDVYMAGPPAMVRAAREAFAAAGVRDERMFFDPFEPAEG